MYTDSKRQYSHITISILVMMLTISILITTTFNVLGQEVPRNLVGRAGEEGTIQLPENMTIPDNILYLIERLEEMKKIASKYNSSLAGEISKIQLELLTGDYGNAKTDLKKLLADLEKLSSILKDINIEDYNKVIDFLNQDIMGLIEGEGLNVSDIVTGGGVGGVGGGYIPNMDIEPPREPPKLEIPRIGLPTAPQINQEYLYIIVALATALLVGYTLRDSGTRSKIKKRLYIMADRLRNRGGEAYPDSHPIIRAYHRFLKICMRRGAPKKPYEAPLEHVEKIKDEVLKEAGFRIASEFEKVKYGYKDVSKDVVDKVNQDISRLEAGEVAKGD